ncbi:MAG: hypothetical protein EOO08_02070 [Chitinophagaceae bacterium]|nr:MAG: hypothetical protein EOO08_02070 [Chitinophagaceae bacterium]
MHVFVSGKKCFSYFLLLFICACATATIAQEPRMVLPVGHNRAAEISFSKDGKQLLTTDRYSVKLWAVHTGMLLVDIKEKGVAVWSPDEMKVLINKDDELTLWDARNGARLNELKGHQYGVSSWRFSPDGNKIVTSSGDETVRVWNSADGKCLVTIKLTKESVHDAFLSADGTKVVTVTEAWEEKTRTVKLWDAASGAFVKRLTALVSKAVPSADGSRLLTVSGNDNVVRVWETAGGALLKQFAAGDVVMDAEFSADAKQAMVRLLPGVIKIWEVQQGKLMLHYEHPGMYAAHFSPDGKRVALMAGNAFSRAALLLDAGSGQTVGNILEQRGSEKTFVTKIAFAPDMQKIAIGYDDGVIRILDAATNSLLVTLRNHSDFLNFASYAADGTSVATVSDRQVRLWNMTTGELTSELRGHTKLVLRPLFSPDSRKLATISLDATARLWDVASGRLVATLIGHKSELYSACFSPAGDRIVTTSRDHTAKLWDATTGALLMTFAHDDDVYKVAFSPDGKRVATTAADGLARVWNTEDGRLVVKVKKHSGPLEFVQFSPDGKMVLTCSWDKTAKAWDAVTGVTKFTLNHTGEVIATSYSPDGKKLLTLSSDHTARIWNAASGTPLVALKGHTAMILAGNFSADGQTVTTVGDHTLRIWNATTGVQLSKVPMNPYAYDFNLNAAKGTLVETAEYELALYNASAGRLVCRAVALDSTDYITISPAGYYTSSRGAAKLLHYVAADLKVITFEQLDVKFNRPDIVLRALGNTDEKLISAYENAYQKRIRKLGIDTSFFDNKGFGLPTADFSNRAEVQNELRSRMLSVHISGNDPAYTLDRFNVWVNEVPVFGVKGIRLRGRNTHSIDTTITLALSTGINSLETSITNVNGTESYRMPLHVNYKTSAPTTEQLHFVGIGINHFRDSTNNLQFSVKDVRDLCAALKSRYGNRMVIDTLFDEAVSVANITALKGRLMQTTENDKVILVYSGHGMLSKDFDYYLSTFDVNFRQPEQGGLPYDALENLLDSIPARRKLMLIDACHSGEVDKEDMQNYQRIASTDSLKKGIEVLVDAGKKRVGTKNSFELMQQIFVDVGRSTGATIISAAGGTQFALERGDLRNGVFTYTILEYLKQNETATVSGLKLYVNKRVPELTRGMQVPTSRAENKLVDWSVW